MATQKNASYAGGPASPNTVAPGWYQVEPGMVFKVIVSSKETGGAYAIVESIAEPGIGSITHQHHYEDEHFVVLEGTAHIVIDGKAIDLYPGQSATLPREVPHAWINRSDTPLRMLGIFSPGGFEQLALDIAEGGGLERFDRSQLRPKYGLEALGPKLDGARE
jgi:mannose-6-phosphate isomerase-like protein (cupin superfamily)